MQTWSVLLGNGTVETLHSDVEYYYSFSSSEVMKHTQSSQHSLQDAAGEGGGQSWRLVCVEDELEPMIPLLHVITQSQHAADVLRPITLGCSWQNEWNVAPPVSGTCDNKLPGVSCEHHSFSPRWEHSEGGVSLRVSLVFFLPFPTFFFLTWKLLRWCEHDIPSNVSKLGVCVCVERT